MISMLVSRNVELYDQWGAASAVGVVLLVAVGVIFFAVSRFIPLDRVLGQKMTMSRPFRIALVVTCALVLLYLILPILIIAPMSFSAARFLTFPPPALSLRWYEEYVGNPAWMQATRVTLTVAVLTVVIATPLGVAAAYAISQSKWRIMRLIHMTLLLPLVVPIIITAVGIFFVFAKVGLAATMTGPRARQCHARPSLRRHLGRGGAAEF
jgi:ABC-type Fe3+ transport system permease subunit